MTNGTGGNVHDQVTEVVQTTGSKAPAHPPYMLIWGVLAVLMLGKVGYAFLALPKVVLTTGLIVIAFVKAALVMLYYMHLKWEPRRLWWLALLPLPLIVILLLVVMQEF
jgi:caa(3)-type oxidase subunit IV